MALSDSCFDFVQDTKEKKSVAPNDVAELDAPSSTIHSRPLSIPRPNWVPCDLP
jgi:hypothetical protein